MADITIGEVVVNILNGKLDDGDFERILDAIRRRRRTLRVIETAKTIAVLEMGAKVELQGLSPKYLNGLTGTVEQINSTRIRVKLDQPNLAPRFARAGVVNAPASCVRALA